MMMAAGTGGHVFPALAVAKQLQQQGCQVSWLATPTGMENRLLKDQNIPIYHMHIFHHMIIYQLFLICLDLIML